VIHRRQQRPAVLRDHRQADGPGGKLEKWPTPKNGFGFDESEMSGSDAVYFTADGEAVHDDHP
jgi:hypothetical protein